MFKLQSLIVSAVLAAGVGCAKTDSTTTTTGTTATAATTTNCDLCYKINMDSVGPVVDTMRLGPNDTAFVVGYGKYGKNGASVKPSDLPRPPGRLMIVRR